MNKIIHDKKILITVLFYQCEEPYWFEEGDLEITLRENAWE